MTVVVVVVAATICLLAVATVGLLHSYGGLLDRVRSLEGGGPTLRVHPDASDARGDHDEAPHGPRRHAPDLVGESPDGGAAVVSVRRQGRGSVVAFLSSSCTSCKALWDELSKSTFSPPGNVDVVVVTKGTDRESPSAVAGLAVGPTAVVMSSDAWVDYEVPGSPYFVFVDGNEATVVGEGTALTWTQVFNLMAMSAGDAAIAPGTPRATSKPRRDRDREAEIDRVLLGAGIFPDDPSLYPSTRGSPGEPA